MPTVISTSARSADQIRDSILKYCRLWGIETIQDDIQIEVSKRLTRSLGRTQPLKKIIRINAELCTTLNEYLEEVICHELAHIASVHQHGTAIKPHGEEWKALVSLAGFEPSVRLQVDSESAISKPPKKYKHYCPVCHSKRVGRRRMMRWRCKVCVTSGLSGQLQIEEMM
jgi:predicted SprT family Zn-dependent metalloprotease